MLPNFLLIGPGRTGTTWLTKSLMSHPDIFMPRCKSTRYFSTNYERGVGWYQDRFRGWSGQRAIGEASVGYLPREEAPRRIHELLPEVKLIATLRHPVDRAYSSYGRLTAVAKKGSENDGISFERKIEVTPRLINEGFYSKHLSRYLEYFPREQMLILFHDDMTTDPAAYLRSIYRFLGVDAEFASPVLSQRINATSTLMARSKLLFALYRATMRLNLFGFTERLDTVNSRKPPKLGREARNRLVERFYIDDISALEGLTGRDLSHWKMVGDA